MCVPEPIQRYLQTSYNLNLLSKLFTQELIQTKDHIPQSQLYLDLQLSRDDSIFEKFGKSVTVIDVTIQSRL